MGNSSSTNEQDVKVADIKAKNELEKTKLECDTKEKIERARVTLEEKKLDCEYKIKTDRLKLEEKQSTIHAEKQSSAMDKFLEKGYDVEDFCMLSVMTYATLKEQQSSEESGQMENILEHMMLRKQNGSRANNGGTQSPPPQYNTGVESSESLEEEPRGRFRERINAISVDSPTTEP